jgi:hypothetical protein
VKTPQFEMGHHEVEKRKSIEEEFYKVINFSNNDPNTYTFEGA